MISVEVTMSKSREFIQKKLFETIFLLIILSFYSVCGLPMNLAHAAPNQWTSIGPEGAIVNALTVDPQTPNNLYAGTYGGIIKSMDGGASWKVINKGLTDPDITALAIDSLDPSTLYAGTAGAGVFKSNDGGQNWAAVNNNLSDLTINALALNPRHPNRICAGTMSGVWETSNVEAGWISINDGLTNTNISSLMVLAINEVWSAHYAGTWGGGVFKNTDGVNWAARNNGLTAMNVKALAMNTQYPFVFYAGTEGGGVFKSSPIFDIMNEAENWSAVNNGLTNLYVRALAIDPENPDILYAATEGGVFKSGDGGGNWTALNSGLTVLSVQTVVLDPLNPSILYAGTQGGGVFKFQPASEIVFAVNCGGPGYTGKNGIVYQADTQFSGGQNYKTTAAIVGTEEDLLYQSERFGNFSYNIPLPNGNYSVTLKFAEIYPYTFPGSRIFSVKAEGQDVLMNLDILSWAGKNKAFDVTIPVSVLDGVLNLEFLAQAGNAKVSAIVVASYQPKPPQEVVFAVNCGGPAYMDKNGIAYQGDTQFAGGQTYKTTAAISETEDDLLYQSERYGNFSYRIPVPTGSYWVTLKFAEIYPFAYSGSRVFNVKVEGKEVLRNLDLVTRVGKNKAYDYTIPIPISVTDGILNIDFYNDRGTAQVNAILVRKEASP